MMLILAAHDNMAQAILNIIDHEEIPFEGDDNNTIFAHMDITCVAARIPDQPALDLYFSIRSNGKTQRQAS